MTDDKPDTSALDAAAEILGYHGCSSGDCPHEKQSECFAALVEAGYDAGHARALKEMGAERDAALAKLKEFDEYYTFQNLERVERQLAAAQGEIERLTGNCEVKDKNKKRLERMYGELEQQLAAAELRAGEYEKVLRGRQHHDEDCLDAAEKFNPNEMCECGASVVKQVLAAHRRGGAGG